MKTIIITLVTSMLSIPVTSHARDSSSSNNKSPVKQFKNKAVQSKQRALPPLPPANPSPVPTPYPTPPGPTPGPGKPDFPIKSNPIPHGPFPHTDIRENTNKKFQSPNSRNSNSASGKSKNTWAKKCKTHGIIEKGTSSKNISKEQLKSKQNLRQNSKVD